MALAFPNTYFVGMSNLGFQTIYTLLNAEPGIVCERVFLPPKSEIAALRAAGTPIVTLESQTPVREFDVLAFSVSFEWDYTNVLTMMTLAGVPQRAAARTAHDPLVMIGGAVTFVNPEPLAPFADVIAAGEGEALVPPLVRAFETASDREELLRLLAAERGYYVPSFYDVHYHADGTIEAVRAAGRAPALRPSCARRRSRPPRRPIRRPPPSSRRTPSSARGCWWRWSAAAPTCAGSAGPATTTCPCARFRRSGSCSWPKPRGRIRIGSAWCRSRSAITPTSRRFSNAWSRWATASARPRCASTI